MTMLDRMRRHKSWLKWSLLLVCLAFVIFYIPAFLNKGPGAVASDAVASVDGRDITVNEFRRAYQTQLQVYRQAYGGNISEQMLKQLGISQQILQQMVDEQAALSEARRQGIDVTDGEVAQRIYSMPAFQENGQFIGQPRYAAMLRMQRPPMTPEEFEDSLRRSLVFDKLRSALTSWVTVPDKEVAQEFKRRNEKVKLDLIVFSADKYRADVKVSDAGAAVVLRRAQGPVPRGRDAARSSTCSWTWTRSAAARRSPHGRSRSRTTTTSSSTRRRSRCAPATSS